MGTIGQSDEVGHGKGLIKGVEGAKPCQEHQVKLAKKGQETPFDRKLQKKHESH